MNQLNKPQNMKSTGTFIRIAVTALILILILPPLDAQTTYTRDTLLTAAKNLMKQSVYCGFVTVDSAGRPQTRPMNPFPLGDDFVIWFATSRNSLKVRQIRSNPSVSIYFANHQVARGYVNITGKATVIDDKELLKKMKRDYWDGIPGWQEIFVLIRIEPEILQVINYEMGINNDPLTFAAPEVQF